MTGPAGSALYLGRVTHRRLRPRVHALCYRIYSLLLDIDELGELDRRLRWFSLDRLNLLSFRRRDVGDGTGDLRRFLGRAISAAGMEFVPGTVRILTMPRVLGFAFNPLTVWFVADRAECLRAILYEVNNTFGERHHYLLPVPPGGEGEIRQSCAKAFHVSPFLAMDLRYEFNVVPPGADLVVAIGVNDSEGPLFSAVQRGDRHELTDAALLGAFVALPLVTVKVFAGILWEATRLWLKRIPLHRHPARAVRDSR